MAAAIALVTLGAMLVYSALKGIGITDILGGATGNPLSPSGGRGGSATVPLDGADVPVGDAAPLDPNTPIKYGLKGPHAGLLTKLTDVARSEYHLSVSQVCRPQNATYGSPTSFHKQCRAVDLTGSTSNKVAFARYAQGQLKGIADAEVFCDQAGMVAPGYDHSDHVHIGA